MMMLSWKAGGVQSAQTDPHEQNRGLMKQYHNEIQHIIIKWWLEHFKLSLLQKILFGFEHSSKEGL